MELNKKETLSVLASVITSLLITLIFYMLAVSKSNLYTLPDIAGGMIFVFILSMIVSASIWPGLIEKKLMKQ